MQFFRKIYKSIELFPKEATEDLCNLGFNSAIDNKDFPPEDNAWIKWKNEPILNKDNSIRRAIKFGCDPNYNYHKFILYPDNDIFLNYPLNNTIFVIPLINNSFFIRGYYSENNVTIPHFPSLSDFINDRQNDKKVIPPTYMGLNSPNLSNFSPYIYMSVTGGKGIWEFVIDKNTIFIPDGLDHGVRSADHTNTYFSDFLPLYSVSVSAGTCVLTKVPYQNDYIDGLYYIVVSPQESVDGKFFSFGGRNFLGAGRNLVVELPSN